MAPEPGDVVGIRVVDPRELLLVLMVGHDGEMQISWTGSGGRPGLLAVLDTIRDHVRDELPLGRG